MVLLLLDHGFCFENQKLYSPQENKSLGFVISNCSNCLYMNKRLLVFSIFLFSALGCKLPDADKIKTNLNFEVGEYAVSLEKARRDHKNIMLHFYANWCPPCKKMRKVTFSNKTLVEKLNNEFINIKMNVDSQDGRMQAARFGVNGFPVVILMDTSEQILYRHTGFVEASVLMQAIDKL